MPRKPGGALIVFLAFLENTPVSYDTVAGILDSTWTWQVLTFILLAPTVFPGEPTRFGLGEYVPDPTEGLVDIRALPAPHRGF